jgi:hypothetical protein
VFKAAYVLVLNLWTWLPVLLFGVIVTGFLLWALLLNFWRR